MRSRPSHYQGFKIPLALNSRDQRESVVCNTNNMGLRLCTLPRITNDYSIFIYLKKSLTKLDNIFLTNFFTPILMLTIKESEKKEIGYLSGLLKTILCTTRNKVSLDFFFVVEYL